MDKKESTAYPETTEFANRIPPPSYQNLSDNLNPQPEHGQPQYDQPQYGQPQYGQAQYGQPQYGQAQYGQSQYAQPQYGQAQYGQPGFIVTGVPQGARPGAVVTTVVGTNVMSTVLINPYLGPKPSAVTCRACSHQIVTRVEYNTSVKTHLLAALLCIIGCWPCAPIPYCVDSCKKSDHYCSNCNAFIGTYGSNLGS